MADSSKKFKRSQITLQNVALAKLCSVKGSVKQKTKINKNENISESGDTTESKDSEGRSEGTLSLSIGSTDESLLTTWVAVEETEAMQFSNQQFDDLLAAIRRNTGPLKTVS